MILHLLRMRMPRNVNRNVYNYWKNVSATANTGKENVLLLYASLSSVRGYTLWSPGEMAVIGITLVDNIVIYRQLSVCNKTAIKHSPRKQEDHFPGRSFLWGILLSRTMHLTKYIVHDIIIVVKRENNKRYKTQ